MSLRLMRENLMEAECLYVHRSLRKGRDSWVDRSVGYHCKKGLSDTSIFLPVVPFSTFQNGSCHVFFNCSLGTYQETLFCHILLKQF